MVEELAERWLEASRVYREDDHWFKARLALSRRDNRVLILGPGRAHALSALTQAMERFLREAGLAPVTLDGDLLPKEHRERAKAFELIVALPVTIGTTAEVLDFLSNDDLADRVVVVLPHAYRDGYFARIVEHDHQVSIRSCGSIGDDPSGVDNDIGKKTLMALATRLATLDNEELALHATGLISAPANVQARMQQRAAPTVSSPNPWKSGSFYLGSFVVVGLVTAGVAAVAGPWAAVPLLAIGVLAVLAIGPLQQRQDGQLTEKSFLELMIEVARNLPRIVGRRGGPPQDTIAAGDEVGQVGELPAPGPPPPAEPDTFVDEQPDDGTDMS